MSQTFIQERIQVKTQCDVPIFFNEMLIIMYYSIRLLLF